MSDSIKVASCLFLFLGLGLARAEEVSNGITTLRVLVQRGRAPGFELIEAKSNRILAKVAFDNEVPCAVTPKSRGGNVAFSSEDSAFNLLVSLGESAPFPLLHLRSKADPNKPGPRILIRMDAPQVFYRGGAEMPAASEIAPVPMSACPVPAAGLWNAAGGVFVGIESQEARCGDKSDRDLAAACLQAAPDDKRPCLALILPASGVETQVRLIYSTSLKPKASPNEFVLKHIWQTYADRLPPAPRYNDLGWLPVQVGFVDAPQPPATSPYPGLSIYTGDPDPADNLDPTFLLQSTAHPISWGTVSWKGTDELLRDMALAYVETGDPVLKYFLQGALQRWPLGLESDGLHSIETLDVCGLGRVTKGMRLGLQRVGEAFAQYMLPSSGAHLRVLCGKKQAIGFTQGAPLDITDYRCDANGLSFEVSGEHGGVFDVIVTAIHQNSHGKSVLVNAQPARVAILGYHGESILVKHVRVGDCITLGAITAPAQNEKAREPAPPKMPSEWNGYRLAVLPYDTALDRSWKNGLSWAGLVEGLHFAWGVPFAIASEAKSAVDLSKRSLPLKMNERAGSVFLFATRGKRPLAVTVKYADGRTDKHELASCYPALVSPPLRRWRIELFPMKVAQPHVPVESLDISGDGLLFALTTHPSATPDCQAALAEAETQRRLAQEEIEQARKRKEAEERIIPDLRAKVAAATRGKALRIAFLPPHETWGEPLRAACVWLGTPPVLLSPEQVIDPREFTPERYPIVVYSEHETFLHSVKQPGDAAQALRRYLAGGGCLVVAGRGFPFFYPTRIEGGKYEKIKGARHGEVCAGLEIFISTQPDPKPHEMLRYELVPGQSMFPHLAPQFKYDFAAGGPYRPITKAGLPPEDVFRPSIVLKDGLGKERGIIAAEIEHRCTPYNGGRVIFLWGNICNTEIGQTVALDLMAHAICTSKLPPGALSEPAIALLPLEAGGRQKAIEHACAAVGQKLRSLTPQEFADPAVFNPRNFPVAIHAVEGEYFLDELGAQKELGQTYVNYIKGGGFLLACGNMYQFYYARSLNTDGKSRQSYDADQLITSALGLQVNNARFADNRPMLLRLAPNQDVLTFRSPMPLKPIPPGRYRAVNGGANPEREFIPIAEICDERGDSFGGYVIALVRLKSKELRGAEALWFCGDLLEDAATHPLLDQAVRYAFEKRKTMFHTAR